MNPLDFLTNPDFVKNPKPFSSQIFESNQSESKIENPDLSEHDLIGPQKTIIADPDHQDVDQNLDQPQETCDDENYCDDNADCFEEIDGISCICKVWDYFCQINLTFHVNLGNFFFRFGNDSHRTLSGALCDFQKNYMDLIDATSKNLYLINNFNMFTFCFYKYAFPKYWKNIRFLFLDYNLGTYRVLKKKWPQ